MTATLLRAGVEIDIPSRHEIRHEVDEALRMRARERAKKRMEVMVPVSGTSASVPGPPNEGYVWSLKLAAAQLSATGSISVYKASSASDLRRPLGNATAPASAIGTAFPAVVTWSSDQARIRHGEEIFILATVSMSGLYVAAWEAPAEMEAEIYD